MALLGGAVGCGSKSTPAIVGKAAEAHAPTKSPPAPKPRYTVAEVKIKEGEAMEMPYILWGGDVATFLANGGLSTKPGTIFDKQGLKFKLTAGDDFEKQVKNYMEGKTPFLRGTFSMLGQSADTLFSDTRTHPVVLFQLTWSAGDHMVAREQYKTLNDLKSGRKKIALQKGGPHVGMLGDILRTAQMSWDNIEVAWTDDVTGDKGPAALFRKDSSVDACFAITPDMEKLTGGIDSSGTGEKETVKGAHVLVSTAHMKRSIADVYACRKDFFDSHRDMVEKFTAGYLRGCEELVDMKKRAAAKDADATARYAAVLKLAVDIYGKDQGVGTPEEADGLVSDAVFVGLPGNISFFTEKGNLSGFEGKQKAALEVAMALGDATARHDFLKPGFDYEKLKKLGGLTGQAPPQNRFREDVKVLSENTLYSFNIYFDPDQDQFPESRYGDDFQRALEMGSLFGNAVISIRGHADPTNLVTHFRNAGGTTDDTKTLIDMVEKNNFGGSNNENFRGGIKYLLDLSKRRAETVRGSVVRYSDSRSYRLDRSQIRSVGVGILEPVHAKARDMTEAGQNRRVEFRIIKVSFESTPPDFDF
jgi:ABC-type nitrate/sulfonate/bicarbonate transport system substrate-binding protein/outer membrane protein OmpA-like peptidoglycan-associated protein